MTPERSSIGTVVRARLAVCAGIAVALLAVTDSAAAASLRLLKTDPVSVRATGFHSGESVSILVKAGQRAMRRSAHADSRGRFTTTVRGISAPACVSLIVTARGSDGSFAVYRRFPLCTTHGRPPA
jgi:hypothetical protein